jgi:hypothetical protein
MNDPQAEKDLRNATPELAEAPEFSVEKQENDELSNRKQVASADNQHVSSKSVTSGYARLRAMWRSWQEHALPERLMAYFTGIVAVCAVTQILILMGGSRQTDDLIQAAKISAAAASKNASAAQSFAENASKINEGISHAVNRLGQQAEATQSAARAAENQARTTHQVFETDSRPYVGFQTSNVHYDPKAGMIFSASIKNFGKIPAQKVSFSWAGYIDGTRLPRAASNFAAGTTNLAPGNTATRQGNIYPPLAKEIREGRKVMILYIAWNYAWRDKSESGCQKEQYDINIQDFEEVGSECPPTR